MNPEPHDRPQPKSYVSSWEQFVDRAMQVLVERPTIARLTIKYIPRKNWFVLKVTDGQTIVMRRANALTEFDQI